MRNIAKHGSAKDGYKAGDKIEITSGEALFFEAGETATLVSEDPTLAGHWKASFDNRKWGDVYAADGMPEELIPATVREDTTFWVGGAESQFKLAA